MEIGGFGPFPSSAAVESLLEMEFTGQRTGQRIMKSRAHQLNRTVEAISRTTVPLLNAIVIRTATSARRDLLAKTSAVKVSGLKSCITLLLISFLTLLCLL